MLETGIRQAATVLLESAIRIAPPAAQEWGMAVRGELNQVESPWAGTMWALGGTGVMVKETLVSLVTTGNLVADGGLFARSPGLRRASTFLSAVCVVMALMFFASPPFRQAFRVALDPWISIFGSGSTDPQRQFHAIARKAESRRDAEGLAFCAVRTTDPRQGARFAAQAVRLDPGLQWIYAVLSLRADGSPDIASAVENLKNADPSNALLHIIAAEFDARAALARPKDFSLEDTWRKEMAAAFNSEKFDDYSDRVVRLTRTVLPRYGIYDPYEVVTRVSPSPPFLAEETQKFAESILNDGENLEAQGAVHAGREQYWSIARFGQMLDSQASTVYEHTIGINLQSLAYRRLEKSSSRRGDHEQEAMFAYLADKFDNAETKTDDAAKEPAFGRETALRNAAVVEVSGLMIVIFLVFVAIAGTILAFCSRHNAGVSSQRAKPVAVMVLLTSALGVLFSSATLYLTYRPYWYIFQAAMLTGEGVSTRDLQEFLNFTQVVPGASHRLSMLLGALIYAGSPGVLFYIWVGVTLFAVFGLALIVLRRFMGRTTNSPK